MYIIESLYVNKCRDDVVQFWLGFVCQCGYGVAHIHHHRSVLQWHKLVAAEQQRGALWSIGWYHIANMV